MKNRRQFNTSSAAETQRVGALVARNFTQKEQKEGALIMALHGDLGSGKTTFAQGFAQELGIKEHVLSPTFLIVKGYPLPVKRNGYEVFVHIDCYRVGGEKDLEALGWRNLIANRRNIVLVEWAERIRDILPIDTIVITIDAPQENERRIIIE